MPSSRFLVPGDHSPVLSRSLFAIIDPFFEKTMEDSEDIVRKGAGAHGFGAEVMECRETPEPRMPQLSPFQPSGQFGYSCKVWIARELAHKYFGGTYHTWFSRELNPREPTGLSSNPLDLYRQIDEAVKRADHNHTKILHLRARLEELIDRLIGERDPSLASELRDHLRNLAMFRPQLWRIDLSLDVESRVQAGKPAWNEGFIPDLREGEFEVIVE